MKALWGAIALLLLLVGLRGYAIVGNGEPLIIPSLAMALLSFPSSVLCILFISFTEKLLWDVWPSMSFERGVVDWLATWFVFFLAGSIQWFVIVPLLRRLRLRRS